MAASTRQAIVILGMHRSGTSALAGVSRLLGAEAPARLMQPAPDNPSGFWESLPISAVNDALFKFVGSHWIDALHFDPAAFDAAARHEMVRLCLPVLHDEFGDAPTFVLKDPRFSLLLELWLPAFAQMQAMVAPIFALRHPAEVTASLRRRDNLPNEVGAAMWLHYSLEAERFTRDRPRALLSYDRLLQDWRGAVRRIAGETGLVWPIDPEAAAAAVDDFLRPQLRHHHAAPNRIAVAKPPLTGWVADTYTALRAVEDGDRDDAFRSLDRVHAEFAAWRAAARIVVTTVPAPDPPPVIWPRRSEPTRP